MSGLRTAFRVRQLWPRFLPLRYSASAGLLSLFQWLLPLTVVALLGTLLWVGSRVETAQQVA